MVNVPLADKYSLLLKTADTKLFTLEIDINLQELFHLTLCILVDGILSKRYLAFPILSNYKNGLLASHKDKGCSKSSLIQQVWDQ